MSAELGALFFSARALDMMPIAAHLLASSGSGYLVTTSTRNSPAFLISFHGGKVAAHVRARPVGAVERESTTSSAVNGVPSENFTPWRRSKNQVVLSTWPHFTASAGSRLRFLSRRTSGS
jgi:hypothetical protein